MHLTEYRQLSARLALILESQKQRLKAFEKVFQSQS